MSYKKVKKEMGNSKSSSNKGKRINIRKLFWVTVLSLGAILATLIYLGDKNNNSFESLYEGNEKQVDLPLCFFVEENLKYNSMLPYLNQLDCYSIDDTITGVENNRELNIYVNRKNIKGVKCEVVNPLTKEIQQTILIEDQRLADYESGKIFSFSVEQLEVNIEYTLRISLNFNNQEVYYYQDIYLSEIADGKVLEKVNKAHEVGFENKTLVKKYIKDTVYVKLNEVSYDIYRSEDNQYTITASYIVVNKKNDSFIYWNFNELYECEYKNDIIGITDIRKRADLDINPVYDYEKKCWILDQENAKDTTIYYSENKRYAVFEIDGDLWFYDVKNNELVRINKQDNLDGDYFIDESREYTYNLIGISNAGNVKYMKLGYQGNGVNAGYNGIEIIAYDYFTDINRSLFFIPFDLGYSDLSTYLEDKVIYNSDINKGQIELNGCLYLLDFDTLEIKQLEKNNEGISINSFGYRIVHNDNLVDNRLIRFENIFEEDAKINEIYYTDYNIRLIDTFDEGMMIGKYRTKDIYESLDTEVFYPYYELVIVDYDGNELATFKADEGEFYGSVMFNGNSFFASTYRLEIIDYLYANNQVRYRKIDTLLIDYPSTKYSNVYSSTILEVEAGDEVDQLLLYNENKPRINEVYTAIDLDQSSVVNYSELKDEDYYEVYEGNNLVNRFTDIDLLISSDDILYNKEVIYKSKEGKREVILSTDIDDAVMIDVPLIKKPDEFNDGDEIIALTMLLKYYGVDFVDEFEIANLIRKDATEYEIIDGIIHYGNMHSGYVGDPFDNNSPNLGVYVEPLYLLVNGISDNPSYQLENLTVDEICQLVGNGYPVLVIYSEDERIVRSEIKTIMTPLGYMEVVDSKDSMLVVGYDKNYMYLNDPQSGSVIKEEKERFENQIDSLGGQGLFILKK